MTDDYPLPSGWHCPDAAMAQNKQVMVIKPVLCQRCKSQIGVDIGGQVIHVGGVYATSVCGKCARCKHAFHWRPAKEAI